MKKLSVSLFALLAITFAVFSAFTTASEKSNVLLSGFFANQNSSTALNDGINADAFDPSDNETETDISSLIGTTYPTLQDYVDENCTPQTEVVCAVQIANDDVIDIKLGRH